MIHKVKKIITISCVLVILLTLIYNTETKLDTIKKDNKLIETSIVHNAPPLIAFTTVALGGFRGIIADILWLRTIILQSQGKYFEMVQLASWISKLQPGFSGTTTFLAWNMAYNISITFANPKEKWKWVQNGITVLKDAIKDTPNSLKLYSELAFIYLNKIGNVYDSSYMYYRMQLANDMHNITGSWNPDWQALTDAPKTINNLNNILKKKFKINNLFKKSGYSPGELQSYYTINRKLPQKISEQLNNNKPATNILLSYLRRNWLISKYHLYPEKIIEINKKIGSLDWMLYQAHSIYWLYTAPNDEIFDNHQYYSRLFVSLNKALQNGELLLFNPKNENDLFTGPNLKIIEPTQKYLCELIAETEYKDKLNQRYQAFMENAILQLFMQNKISVAEKYLHMLNIQYPNEKNYNNNLKTFTKNMILQKFLFHNETFITSEIEKAIKLSYIYTLQRKKTEAEGVMNFAKILYSTFNLNNKKQLPDFIKIKERINTSNIKKYLINKTDTKLQE